MLPENISDKKTEASSFVNLSYTYDNNLNVESIVNHREPQFSLTELVYDDLDRLTETKGADHGVGKSKISYDGLGNIQSYSNTSVFKEHDYEYKYDTNNRLSYVHNKGNTSQKVRNFSANGSYDKRGHVLNNGQRSFSYNVANQMIRSGSNRYLYDGFDRRIKTNDSKGISYSMYSQAGKLLFRSTPEGNINYIFLGTNLLLKKAQCKS